MDAVTRAPAAAATAAAIAIAIAAGEARGDPCAVAPVELGVREGDLGAPRSPCVERRVHLRMRGLALVDVPSFYGTLDAGATAGIRWPIGPMEGSIELRLVDWRFAQNASLAASELGAGPVTVGALAPLRRGVAASVRWVLPFTETALDVPATAGELALHVASRPMRALTLHGTSALLAWVAALPEGADARAALLASTGAALSPLCWLDLLAGVEAQGGWYGATLDHLLARGGLRIRLRDHAIDVFALFPLAGAERTDLAITLGWSFSAR